MILKRAQSGIGAPLLSQSGIEVFDQPLIKFMQYSLGHDCSIVLEQIDQIVLICRDNSVNFVGSSLKLGLTLSNLLHKISKKK